MAIGQILQFSGATIDKYDAVRQELGWDGDKGKPEGILAPGDTVKVKEGMVFNVSATGQS